MHTLHAVIVFMYRESSLFTGNDAHAASKKWGVHCKLDWLAMPLHSTFVNFLSSRTDGREEIQLNESNEDSTVSRLILELVSKHDPCCQVCH